MKRNITLVQGLALFLMLPVLGFAQPGSVSEEEVNIQQVYIEANLERMMGNYENAAFLFKEVLKRDKNNHAAAYELARVYEALNNEEKALKSIQSAIALDPQNIWYREFLAQLYKKTGNDRAGADVYDKLTQLQPETEEHYVRWAYFLVRAGEVEKAISVYDKLERKMGISEEIIRRKYTLYLGMGNHKKAERELTRLVEAYPSEMDYRHDLAEFFTQIGDEGAARKIYEAILQLDPNNAKAGMALVRSQPRGTDPNMTQLHGLKVLFEKPDIHIDVKIAELFPYVTKVAETSDADLATAALELTDILEEVHPDEAKAFSVAGDLLFHTDQLDAALDKYKKTLELNDNIFLVWEQIMYIHSEVKDFDQLRTVSEEVMDIFPNQPLGYYYFGLANNRTGNFRASVPVLQQALLMVGDNGRLKFDIHSLLGNTYHQLGEYDSADENYGEALNLNPKEPWILDQYARELSERGEKLSEAAQMSKLANELAPGQYKFQDTYGLVLYRLRKFEQAKEWFSKAMNSGGGDDPSILEHLGDALFQTEDVEDALEMWQKALEKGSTSDVLEKKVADRALYE